MDNKVFGIAADIRIIGADTTERADEEQLIRYPLAGCEILPICGAGASSYKKVFCTEMPSRRGP